MAKSVEKPTKGSEEQEPNKVPKKRRFLAGLIYSVAVLIFMATIASYVFRYELGLNQLVSSEAIPKPDPERYVMLTEDLEIRRKSLSRRYRDAGTEEARQAVLQESSQLLQAVLPDMMRCWLGTPWDFHGTCDGPGKGKIACGYFVSTTLKDAGFKVDRYKLAQQPSQNIIRTFVDKSRIQIRAGMGYYDFLTMMKELPKGIYLVGLDKHVGFIVHEGKDKSIRFIHSSGRTPYRVVDETEPEAISLKYSNYRVIGNLTAEDDTIKKWLLNQSFPVTQ
ncbi:hypothetical protein SAMN02745181_2194 [Rubritalea squalenifaciens DSM 18772]|uniref:Uncharacterized protein n=1 Tax=Rubritalea squalenifaciens DSM 18772 TaxID=1123071 RepID=A0A1M6KSL4_9BACT|nr:hypothetical protein [Rubritalea squalenifaciens]SHJ61951.1 hypothetical protein SAMN02745181_2194 [Rubritalea squalenifaciens DSM 18772]